MKRIKAAFRCVGGAFLLWSFSHSVAAVCVHTGGYTQAISRSIDFGDVYVSSGKPAGAMLAEAEVEYYGGNYNCSTAYAVKGRLGQFKIPFNHPIYKTNVEGIGIRINVGGRNDYPYQVHGIAGDYGLGGAQDQGASC